MSHFDEPFEEIQGWGADLDSRNRPAVPKENQPFGGTGAHWLRPEPQHSKVKVLKSIERPEMTSVFGTTLPPRGLSGLVRRQAFKFSEGRYSHWLLLLLADRINMIEGLVSDLLHGHVPNVFQEMGWNADAARPRTAVRRKMMVASFVFPFVLLGVAAVAAVTSKKAS